MTIAVVILNWNGKALLEQFLPSVTHYSKSATIYMADNASTDNSVEYVKKNYPEVHIIQNKTNGGYSKGYNDALTHVNEDIYVLLNSDVAVTENWLEPVLSAFQEDHTLVAAQPKILDFNKPEYFEYAGAAGGFIDKMGYPFCRGRIFTTLEKDTGQYNDSRRIFWASGACFFVRKNAFWEVGGLDEDLFAHQEEIDLCWRLQTKGGVVKYIGAAAIYHLGGATLAAANPKKTFYNFRNTLLVLVKNVKGNAVWWLVFQRMLLDGVAGIQFLTQGKVHHFLAILKAHISFYSLLPKYLQKRKKWASTLNYQYITSIVWQYFVKGKKNFKKLT